MQLVAHVMPYALGDSPAGIDSVAGKALGIDLNIRTCLSADRNHRVIVLAHWEDWWNHGFVAKPGTTVPRKPIEELTVDQVANLWSKAGHHPIITGTAAIDLCLAARLVPCFEMKPSVWTKDALQDLVDHADAVGLPIVFMTIQSYGKTTAARNRWEAGALHRMTLVHDLEQNSMLIYRRPITWPTWGPVLTAIKGHTGNRRYHVVTAATLVKQLHKEIPMATKNPRQARSLDVLEAEINAHAPGRYKASDGGLGDQAHAARKSDHNPNAAGVWRARDFTNDPDDHDGNPANDLPGQDLANRLAAKLGKHPAMKSGAYVIFNRRIISFDRLAEAWRPYDGANAHQKHVHVSVSTAAAGYDSKAAWNLWPKTPPPTTSFPNIDDAIDSTEKAIERRDASPVRTDLESALKYLNSAKKKAQAIAATKGAAR